MLDDALKAPSAIAARPRLRRRARRLLKRLVFGMALVVASPMLLASWVEKRARTGDSVFAGCSQLLALIPGQVGSHIRASFYYGSLDHCSWEVHIGFGSIFTHRAASLGSNVSTGAYCVIGHAEIGDGVRLASRVSIPSGRRQHVDALGRLASVSHFRRIAVHAGSWVGEGAIVMADLGAHCIVGAGAVVIDEVPAACVVAGNPAKVIGRNRGSG
jgi:acetyltransferase-like isoleucine patch superfamily enzyme